MKVVKVFIEMAICLAVALGAFCVTSEKAESKHENIDETTGYITETTAETEETKCENETTIEPSTEAETEVQPEAEYIEMTVTATAYCPCLRCTDGDGLTATNTKATAGRTIAVDPRKIPYGTEVIINGNTYIAEDCGGAIKENRIDIYFDTHEEALQFGIQKLTAYIKIS